MYSAFTIRPNQPWDDFVYARVCVRMCVCVCVCACVSVCCIQWCLIKGVATMWNCSWYSLYHMFECILDMFECKWISFSKPSFRGWPTISKSLTCARFEWQHFWDIVSRITPPNQFTPPSSIPWYSNSRHQFNGCGTRCSSTFEIRFSKERKKVKAKEQPRSVRFSAGSEARFGDVRKCETHVWSHIACCCECTTILMTTSDKGKNTLYK